MWVDFQKETAQSHAFALRICGKIPSGHCLEFSCIFSQRQLTISRLREIASTAARSAAEKKQLWDSQVGLKMEHMIAYATFFSWKENMMINCLSYINLYKHITYIYIYCIYKLKWNVGVLRQPLFCHHHVQDGLRSTQLKSDFSKGWFLVAKATWCGYFGAGIKRCKMELGCANWNNRRLFCD